MKGSMESNALFKASHMLILTTYSIMACALIAETFLMDWEKWAVILIVAAICLCWYLHIRQLFSDRSRLMIYTACMMLTGFYYGIHPTSTFDLATVMCMCILLCATTGIKFLVTLSQITFFVTYAYDIIAMFVRGETFDGLVISRIMLQVLLVVLAGWLGRSVIERWNQVLEHSKTEMKALTESTERLNDFLTSVSHEIRTPINAVQGLSGICLERAENPEQRENLGAIQGAGRRMTELVSDILDYSDIDRGRSSVIEEDYMLSSVLHDLVTNLKPYMHSGVELIIDVDPAIPSVMHTDVGKLKKILWHLTTNALKFTKAGGVYVRIAAEMHDYGINLLLDVSDTGIGMSAEVLNHLSEGFYFQADSSRTRSSGGLGLGMSIVYGFVTALGGFIKMESRQGEGTSIHVCLPQKVVDPTSCMSVRNRDQLVLGAFLHFDKFPNPVVREYYNTMVRDVVRGLGVQMHRVDNPEDLKKLVESIRLTHLFVGQEEYESDVDLMERLAQSVTLTVVAAEGFALPDGSAAHVMEKPFYCFPVAVTLNREFGEDLRERYMYCRGVRALVVDDEPLNITVARDILRRYGIEVTSAESGLEALSICAQESFDLVFMDHMMPGMDGIETMRRIRSEGAGSWKTVPMVALTANAGSAARETFRQAGFDGFVAKPIDLEELERVLRGVLPASRITYEDTPHARGGRGKKAAAESTAAQPAPVSPAAPTDGYAPLRELGVDVRQGLRYCQNDDEFYRTLLGQFAAEAGGKRAELERFAAQQDMPNYAIYIHALKSTAKMIGAEALSEKARALEEASKAGRTEEVAAGHPAAMEAYDALTRAIFAVVGGAPAEEASDAGAEDGALEFAPEAADDEVLEFVPDEGVTD